MPFAPISDSGWTRRALLATAAAAPALAAVAAHARDDAESPRAVVARFRHAYQALDGEVLLALLAPDVRFVDPTFHMRAEGRERVRPMIEHGVATLSDVRLEVANEIVADPWVVVQQRQSGRHLAPGASVPHRFSVEGASIFRVEGGLIREWWDYYDVLTFREQASAAAG